MKVTIPTKIEEQTLYLNFLQKIVAMYMHVL